MKRFTVIGENIHATRVLRLNGKRVGDNDEGVQSVKYYSDGETKFMTIPDEMKKTQPYQQGQAKHFMIAVWKGLFGNSRDQEESIDYIKNEIKRQEAAGANFLDLNVDEMSHKLDIQIKSMKWLVSIVEEFSSVPPSIDSSNSEIIQAGLAQYTGKQGRPMINSIALERVETFDLVQEFDASAILTGASEDGMPSNSDERVANINKIVDISKKHDINFSDIHLDPLVFPISVAPEYGVHFFDAVEKIRELFGDEINISGGLSNVSFGLPRRKLVNDVFIYICLQRGLDSGIIDPLQLKIDDILALDENSEDFKIAENMLMGRDDFCMNYIKYCREG
ncbi:MAG: dihydropteroate synthase [Chloroflexota bacterium]|nr:dihydropteroate synthase [Chloroflexota bacterium]